MNRLNLLLLRALFAATLLFLVSSSAVYAQVTYTLMGTLSKVSGSGLDLTGDPVIATATISQSMVPTTSSITATSSSNTYIGVTVTLAVIGGNFTCTDLSSTQHVTVVLTDTIGGPDTIAISNCNVAGLAGMSATATIPDGSMITAVPASMPSTTLISSDSTVTLTLSGVSETFDLIADPTTKAPPTLVAIGTAPPTVTPSPVAWTPSAQIGSTTAQSQNVTFTTSPSAADAAVSFSTSVTTTDGGHWLSVSPSGTNTGSPITIKVDPTGLNQPSYTGNVILTFGPSYSTLKIPVTFTLSAPSVSLTGPASMTFNYTLGDAAAPASQTLNIGSSPASSTSVTAAVTSGNSWLSITPPPSGITPASFTISVNTAGLSAGTLNGNIQITAAGATNSPLNIPVTYNVSASTLTVPSTPLTFNYTVGGATPTSQSVSISGTAGIAFTTSTGGASAWLSATPSGTVPSSISVSINAAGLSGLSVGPHTGTVTVTSTGATGSPASIPVTLNVIAPVLTTNTSQLNFTYQLGSATQPVSQSINVGDASNVSFTATPATMSGGPWLSVNPAGGSASGSIGVSVSTTGLAAGIYSGTVTIAATGATSQVVNVTLTVASVTVSTSSLSFAFQLGGTVPVAQNVNIGGTAGLAFTATPAGGSWLSVTPGGTISGSSSISVSVNTTGLAANTYNGTITVAAPGAVSQVINVTLTVSNNPTLSASPSTLSFTYTIGGTAPAAQAINVGGSSGLTFTAVAASVPAGSWLSAAPVSPGTTPGSASVSVNVAGLTAGTYNGSVTIGATGATSQVVTVTLVVSNSLTVSTSSLTFNYTVGGAAPAAQSIGVSGTAGITFTATAATIPSGGSWLSAAPVSPGTTPGSASVSIVTAGLTPGTYNGMVTIGNANATSQVVTVTLVVVNSVTISTSSLSFNYTIGGAAPASQPVTIGGTPALAFTATPTTTSGGSWLAAAATSPTPGSVSVSIVTTGLTTAGTFKGMVTIAAANATPQVINVTLVVTSQPTITSSSLALSFTYNIGGTTPAAQTLTIGGTAGLAYTATVGAGTPWLSATPAAPSTISGTTSVSINTSGLTTAGTFNGTVTIAAAGATSQVVNVTLTVATPAITAAPMSLSFTYQIGGTMPNPKSITIGGTAGLAFTATAATTPSGGSWLSATAVAPSTAPGSVTVSINTASLTTPGTVNGTVTIAAAGATPQTVNVSVIVTTAPLTAAPASLSFKFTIGGTAPLDQGLNILGGEGLAFTAAPGSGASWLSVTATSGVLPILLSVSVNPTGLTAGAYHSNVIITAAGAPNSPFSVPVTFTVTGGKSTISVSSTSLSFAATVSGATPVNQTVNVAGSAPTAVTVSTVGGAWLSATLSPAKTPAVVTVAVNQSGLAVGSYMGTVVVSAASASDSPQNISVSLVVSAPVLTATPPNVSFAYTLGGSAPAAQGITITSTAQVSIATSIANGPWLTLTSSSATTPATLTLGVNTGTLTAGAYSATISITSAGASNSPLIVPVALVVSGKPSLSATPTNLTFTGQSGGTNPASQSISVTGPALPFTIVAAPSWLGVSASASTSPSTLIVTVNSTGMAKGSYQGSITITSASAGNSPVTIPVALNLTAPLVVTTPSISTIVNAASYDNSGFAPGAIVSIFGSLLGPQTGVSFSLNSKGSLDDTLAGASVTVSGIPAIPLFVQNGQVNVILPFTLGFSGTADVEVQYNNQTSADFTIPLTPADVQIFTADASGSGPGSILNQDFSVNSATNGAPAGTVVQIFGTGGGTLNPQVNAGDVAGDTLAWVTLPYSATVNGEDAKVLYAGSAPGLVYGVYQFNVQLPADLPSGPVRVVLNIGGSMSQSNVTVFVQ